MLDDRRVHYLRITAGGDVAAVGYDLEAGIGKFGMQ
jgi:hypothetical protein